MGNESIKKRVGEYYTEKINTHGASPLGVDWNSEESQFMRFQQLLKIIEGENPFSILDFGCGFGSMFGFMKSRFQDFKFSGFDLSEAMIREAAKLHPDGQWTTRQPSGPFDFVVASGIFNVRLETPVDAWKTYIEETLHVMNQVSTRGFSFNILTAYSDKEFMKDYLFYADPLYYFDFCKKHFSKRVALLHDYPLYEFSLLVRK